MMNLELALHVVVLEGQQALDIVQPSVHFGGHISAEDFRANGGETYIVLRSSFQSSMNWHAEGKHITYDRTKIVANLMSDDLPFSPSGG